jgi:predicted ATPase
MKLQDIKIHINHFGPLDDIELSLAPLIIITGKSNLGKSYANYLIYYFMSSILNGKLFDFFGSYFDKEKDEYEFEFKYSDLEQILKDRCQNFIRTFLGDEHLTCDVDFKIPADDFKFKYQLISEANAIDTTESLVNKGSQYLCSFFVNGEPFYKNVPFRDRSRLWIGLNIKVLEDLSGKVTSSVLLPPGRGAFVGENYSMKNDIASSLGMYQNFFRDYDWCMKVPEVNRASTYNEKFKRLIHGDLETNEGKQYMDVSPDDKIALSAAASSVKELSPLFFFLKNRSTDTTSFCFEEPEAHVHPSAQLDIADIMAKLLNCSDYFNITTHSDYFLQRINQLIKLGDIRTKDKKKFQKVIEQLEMTSDTYIDREMVKAYYFERDSDGHVKVTDMKLTEDGIPFRTFFDTVKLLRKNEDAINDCLYELKEEGE